jgi:hypothetical protein
MVAQLLNSIFSKVFFSLNEMYFIIKTEIQNVKYVFQDFVFFIRKLAVDKKNIKAKIGWIKKFRILHNAPSTNLFLTRNDIPKKPNPREQP